MSSKFACDVGKCKKEFIDQCAMCPKAFCAEHLKAGAHRCSKIGRDYYEETIGATSYIESINKNKKAKKGVSANTSSSNSSSSSSTSSNIVELMDLSAVESENETSTSTKKKADKKVSKKKTYQSTFKKDFFAPRPIKGCEHCWDISMCPTCDPLPPVDVTGTMHFAPVAIVTRAVIDGQDDEREEDHITLGVTKFIAPECCWS